MNLIGSWEMMSKAFPRPSAMSGPVLTTSRSPSAGKRNLIVSVLGSEIADRDADARKSKQEFDAPHAAKFGRLSRRQSPTLKELRGQEKFRLAFELLPREGRFQEHGVVVGDG
jgi:hypothetical protein